MQSVHVARVQPNGMSGLCRGVTVLEEVVRHLRRASHFTCSLQTEDEEVEYQAIVLEYESGELEASNHAISVSVRHILVC